MKKYFLILIYTGLVLLSSCGQHGQTFDATPKTDSTMVAMDTNPQPQRIGIKMTKEGGVYTLPCLVNGVKMNFIFDTGASNVCISLTEALFLYKNGYIDDDDLGEKSYSQVADGRITANMKLNIKTIEIGGMVLRDIDALVSSSMEAPLLLGQSAIQKLGKVELAGDSLFITGVVENPQLLIKEETEKKISTIPPSNPQISWWDKVVAFFGNDAKVNDYINKAWNAYNNDLTELGMDYCNKAVACNEKSWKAYALRGHFNYWEKNYYNAANDYEQVIKYNKNRESFILDTNDSITYKRCIERLSWCYCESGLWNKALLFAQEQLAYYPESNDLINSISLSYTMSDNFSAAEKWSQKLVKINPAMGHFRLAFLYAQQGRMSEAAKYYERVLLEDPAMDNAMNNLSNIYWKQGYYKRSLELKREAAALGNDRSQEWLKKNGYDW